MLGLAVFASLCYLASAHKPPPFVRDLDCPKYTVLQSFPGYELRRYEMSQWVATRDLLRGYGALMNYRENKLVYKLFRYISGENTLGMKIPMIYPMLMTVYPEVGRNYEQSVMEMHFMIPHHMQPFPPAPTDPTVYITMLPPMDVYVKSLGGFANTRMNLRKSFTNTRMNLRKSFTDNRMNLRKVKELMKQINNRNLYHGDHFYKAGYDGTSSMNRHDNEVWLVAKN
ncbi:heme-binding protein 2 isoform X1 [Magallana gigas]|nr:heme-binding protein 2 isoform X1 [Crassostrea gigas]XP_034326789.1 heme-binding protein 2 isoform X1 [Crassostrea gigas]